MNTVGNKEYKMTLANQNVTLSVYRRMLHEYETCQILRGGGKNHYERMKECLELGAIICWKCVTKIDIDSMVKSKKGKNFTKIWHLDCYHEY